MSNNNDKELNNVSDSIIDISKIKEEIETKLDVIILEGEYKDFCRLYSNIDFSQYNVERLKRIYDIGKELLNQYFITNCNTIDSNIIIKLQHITSDILYNINIKQLSNLNQQNQSLNKKLEKTIEEAKKMETDASKRSIEVKHLKNDMKSITTTIISIILAISIIPTAVAGIEKISPNYILPFLSSIILFGIIMITFVYSIYQDKLKKSTCAILILTIILTVILWIVSIINAVNIEKVEKEKSAVNEISNVGD